MTDSSNSKNKKNNTDTISTAQSVLQKQNTLSEDSNLTQQSQADVDYLKNSLGSKAAFTSDEEAYMQDILEELALLSHKEKKLGAEAAQAQQSQNVKSKLKNAPEKILKPAQDVLLGILGPCSLKGHIVHFFNLQFDIEKHIKDVSELKEPRFVEAYHYLRQNPSVDAVFVYENRMAAAYLLNGSIKFKPL